MSDTSAGITAENFKHRENEQASKRSNRTNRIGMKRHTYQTVQSRYERCVQNLIIDCHLVALEQARLEG